MDAKRVRRKTIGNIPQNFQNSAQRPDDPHDVMTWYRAISHLSRGSSTDKSAAVAATMRPRGASPWWKCESRAKHYSLHGSCCSGRGRCSCTAVAVISMQLHRELFPTAPRNTRALGIARSRGAAELGQREKMQSAAIMIGKFNKPDCVGTSFSELEVALVVRLL